MRLVVPIRMSYTELSVPERSEGTEVMKIAIRSGKCFGVGEMREKCFGVAGVAR